VQLTEIGKVEKPCGSAADHFRMREKKSHILIYENFAEGMYGLGESKHIQVLFGFHPPRGFALKCLTDCGDIKGVFATLSPERPSPLGVTTVELVGVEKTSCTCGDWTP